VARLAVRSGLFPLFEAEYGEMIGSTKIRDRVPVEEYLAPQRRFAHVLAGTDPAQLEGLRRLAERNIRKYRLLEGFSTSLATASTGEAAS
jgi:pyruvate ferredoxin oxidoreductase beta subunit